MRFSIMAAILLFAGGACTAEPDSCGKKDLEPLLGQLVEQMKGELPEKVRILPPGSVMTQDFRPDRVNVDLDEDGRIVRFWCG